VSLNQGKIKGRKVVLEEGDGEDQRRTKKTFVQRTCPCLCKRPMWSCTKSHAFVHIGGCGGFQQVDYGLGMCKWGISWLIRFSQLNGK